MSAPARRALVRALHSTTRRHAATKFVMPAMSPTMTEGAIAHWKKKEGESFSAGDVLLEIETDKATIDVEAQDEGVLAKILAADGTKNVPVGKMIAVIAEQGDDISTIEMPKDDPPPPPPPQREQQSSPPPSSRSSQSASTKNDATPASKPTIQQLAANSGGKSNATLFPSVQRLLQEHGVSSSDVGQIKGTGIRGMLTKGDVLAHLGLASTPTGTYVEKPAFERTPPAAGGAKKAAEPPKVFDGPAVRRLIAEALAQTGKPSAAAAKVDATFASILADYNRHSASKPSAGTPVLAIPPAPTSKPSSYLDGLI